MTSDRAPGLFLHASLDFFGGVPEVLVPDQLRSAVSGPDRYDPDINGTLLTGRHAS